MNEPRKELSLDLLTEALDAALTSSRVPKEYPLVRMIARDTRWEGILRREEVTHLRGYPVEVMSDEDMLALFKRKLKSNWGFSDYSVILVPDECYDWARGTPLMLDLDFEHTAKIEEYLYSGKLTVMPAEGEFQWWYSARINRRCEGFAEFADLVTGSEYHGYQELSDGETSVRIHDDSGDISNSSTGSTMGDTLPERLAERGVKVHTGGLRYESNKALEYAARCETWAARLEGLQSES